MKELKVHPAADIFPMMSDEALANLAAHIKANGLIHPIVLDAEGQLIDGRNRHAACLLAGIEPSFESLNGRDPLAYIAGANLERRSLTQGQHAMAYAMIYPEPEKRGRGNKRSGTGSFTNQRLSEARVILEYSPPLAQSVLAGVTPLDQALRQVDEQKKKADGESARLERLRKLAPDLMALVEEERMKLDDADTLLQKREAERKAIYQAGVFAKGRLGQFSSNVLSIITGAAVQDEDQDPIEITDEEFRDAKDALARLKKFKEGKINATIEE